MDALAYYPDRLFYQEQANKRNLCHVGSDTLLTLTYHFIEEDILGHFANAPMVPLYVVMGHMARAAQTLYWLTYSSEHNQIPMITSFENPRFAYRRPKAGDFVHIKAVYTDDSKIKVTCKSDNVKASMKFTVELQNV